MENTMIERTQILNFSDVQPKDILCDTQNGSILYVIDTRVARFQTLDALVQDVRTKNTYTLTIGRTYSGIHPHIHKLQCLPTYVVNKSNVLFAKWEFRWQQFKCIEDLVETVIGSSLQAEPEPITFKVWEVKYDLFAWFDDGSFTCAHEERFKAFHDAVSKTGTGLWNDDEELMALGVVSCTTFKATPNSRHEALTKTIERLEDKGVACHNIDYMSVFWDIEIAQQHYGQMEYNIEHV